MSLDSRTWVADHGDMLFACALAATGDRAAAEDLVQETFLAALRNKDSFAGASSERTWLVGILKHKVIDYYRKSGTKIESHTERTDNLESLFDRSGRWKRGRQSWTLGDPEREFDRKQLREFILACMKELRDNYRTAFVLREFTGSSSEEVCKTMGITTTNLNVILHRARLALQKCLDATTAKGLIHQ